MILEKPKTIIATELRTFNVKTALLFLKNFLSPLPNSASDNCIMRLPAKTPSPFSTIPDIPLVAERPAKPTNRRIVRGLIIVKAYVLNKGRLHLVSWWL